MKYQNIQTVAEVEQGLRQLRGARFVTIVAQTVPKMRKRGNPYHGRVYKVSRINGCVNFDYAGAVNRRREKVRRYADFVAAPRAWGQMSGGMAIIEHEGKKYLRIRADRVLSEQYLLDGWPIDKSLIAEYLPADSTANRQNLDNKVVVKSFDLRHIKQIHGLGEPIVVAESLAV